ncbi:MAG: hypothetical protein AAB360_01820 [Patescibacteria group bacterium]
MKYFGILSLFTILILPFSSVRAASYRLPEVMVGQTTLVQEPGTPNQKTYYGGWQGNEAVINFYPDILFGFNESIAGCNLETPACFTGVTVPAGLNVGLKAMTGKSYINDKPKTELATLFYPRETTVIGDTYGADNFKYWGKNLAQSGRTLSEIVDATWQVENYSLNNQSQSAISGEAYRSFEKKMKVLAAEAPPVNAAILASQTEWHLQGKDNGGISGIADMDNSDAANYPEGKTWIVNGDLVLNPNQIYTYHGRGTIIIKGRLTVPVMTKIKRAKESDQLGIVALEN